MEDQINNPKVALDQENDNYVNLSPMSNKDYFLPVSILVSGLLVAGSILFASGSFKKSASNQQANLGNSASGGNGDTEAALKIKSGDVVLGDAKAPVTIIEYGDYQCPFCMRFSRQTEPLLREEFIKTGKVKMVFRNFQFLGPESQAAGLAAKCAQDQNKFWSFHDAIYAVEEKDGRENNGNLTRDLFMQLAGNLKLDTAAFGSCFDAQKYRQTVEDETKEGTAAGVNSTPTIFVNGTRYLGALPWDNAADPRIQPLKPIIEKALQS